MPRTGPPNPPRTVSAVSDVLRLWPAIAPTVESHVDNQELHDFFSMVSGAAAPPLESLSDVIDVAIHHRLRPPLELMLFARTLLAFKATLERIDPARGLPEVLIPLVLRLPELRAALD